MRNFTRLEKIVILIIALLLITTLGFKIFSNSDKNGIQIEESGLLLDETDNNKDEDELFLDENEDELEEDKSHIVIHITGEVQNPGVITLKNGDRVVDAIKKAGGLSPYADENKINLAQKLFDEDKVIIPGVGDTLENENLEGTNQQVSQAMIINGSNENSGASQSGSDGGININTASGDELKTLPGIGDVTAQKIIDYRENTKFNSIEDIKNVSGIGEKKFEAIKSMITTR